MTTEPPHKKPKLKLSDPDGPLTRHDVIAYQKEALFRCLNETRTALAAITTQYDTSRGKYDEVSGKLGELFGLIGSVATFIRDIARERGNTEDEELCRVIIEGDDSDILRLSDKFMAMLTRYVVGGNNNNSGGSSGLSETKVSDQFSRLGTELKQSLKRRQELSHLNSELLEEIKTIMSYYQKLIRKYDREDSATIERVFKKELGGEESATVSSNSDNSDGSKTKIQTTGHSLPSLGSSDKDLKTETAKKAPDVDQINDSKGESLPSGNQKGFLLDYELKIKDLQNEIRELKVMIDELEKNRSASEVKITDLEKRLSPSSETSGNNSTGATNNNSDNNNNNISNNTNNSNNSLNDSDERKSILEKINYLTKENLELKEANDSYLTKFQELSSEKEIYNQKLTEEFESTLENLMKQNASLEKDLVRIRTARDDLLSKVSILEAETKQSSLIEDLKRSLELSTSQWEKFQSKNESQAEQQSQDVLLKELQDMEKAFKELTQLNNKKYSELVNQESVVSKFKIEKTKADQKYFAAMRSKDSILIENKNLSKTVSKSNELISQLRDSEKLLQQRIENLHKQLKLSQNNEKRLINSNKSESLKIMDLNSQINKSEKKSHILKQENLRLIADLNRQKTLNEELEVRGKGLEQKVENLNEKCNDLRERLVSMGQGGSKRHHDGSNGEDSLVEELENFRTLVYCPLCSKNWKDMAIRTCGHVFCKTCCKERLAARMRKCPTCNNPFSASDLLAIHL